MKLALASAAATALIAAFAFESDVSLGQPRALTVAGTGERLGLAVRYSGPGFGDVDGDGVAELVLGGLQRTLDVFEPTDDPLVWRASGPLEVGGEPVRLDNW